MQAMVGVQGGTDPMNELGTAHRPRQVGRRRGPRPYEPAIRVSDDSRAPRILTADTVLLQQLTNERNGLAVCRSHMPQTVRRTGVSAIGLDASRDVRNCRVDSVVLLRQRRGRAWHHRA